MAFLSKLFGGKDARHYLDKADRLFAEGRYADARHTYSDALEKLAPDDALLEEVRRKMGATGDALAAANIQEAEWCFSSGDPVKAHDHLELAAQLAVDSELKGRIAVMRQDSTAKPASVEPPSGGACSCSGGSCSPAASAVLPPGEATDEHLSDGERFELLTAALPGDLPVRYRALGDTFRDGYLLAHAGDPAAAAKLFRSLDITEARDILLYESALICHEGGDLGQCESLLRQALRANDRNPLCYLALVDLCTGTGNFDEALSLLDTMVTKGLLADQALMTRGDILEHLGEDEPALETFAGLLGGPHKKEAATRIIPILERLGRVTEARQVFAQYVKGCC